MAFVDIYIVMVIVNRFVSGSSSWRTVHQVLGSRSRFTFRQSKPLQAQDFILFWALELNK